MHVDELEACFVVRDGAGRGVAYVYFEERSAVRQVERRLSKSEARRWADRISGLAEGVE